MRKITCFIIFILSFTSIITFSVGYKEIVYSVGFLKNKPNKIVGITNNGSLNYSSLGDGSLLKYVPVGSEKEKKLIGKLASATEQFTKIFGRINSRNSLLNPNRVDTTMYHKEGNFDKRYAEAASPHKNTFAYNFIPEKEISTAGKYQQGDQTEINTTEVFQ